MTSESWFVQQNGVSMGPIPDESFRDLARMGVLTAETRISADGRVWNAAAEVDQIEFGPAKKDELWYTRSDSGNPLGPIPESEIRSHFESGEIPKHALVSRDGVNWITLETAFTQKAEPHVSDATDEFGRAVEAWLEARLAAIVAIWRNEPQYLLVFIAIAVAVVGGGLALLTQATGWALTCVGGLAILFGISYTNWRTLISRPDWGTWIEESKREAERQRSLSDLTVKYLLWFGGISLVILLAAQVNQSATLARAENEQLAKAIVEDLRLSVHRGFLAHRLDFVNGYPKAGRVLFLSDIGQPHALKNCNFIVNVEYAGGKSTSRQMTPSYWAQNETQSVEVPNEGTIQRVILTGSCLKAPGDKQFDLLAGYTF